jgi:predicted RNA-binding Zn ribbon-like protein
MGMTCQVVLLVTAALQWLGVDIDALTEQIEYKVAPAPLIAVQGLANTFAFEPAEERLISPDSAGEWLRESGLTAPGTRVSEAERERLVAFRAIIRELIVANRTGDVGRAAAGLDRVAAEHRVGLVAGKDGQLALDLTPPGNVEAVIAQMLGIVFRAQLEGQWPRLKVCASDECRWAFFDSSRNQGGTWCQMSTCGNRLKNRAYRRRKASGGPTSHTTRRA